MVTVVLVTVSGISDVMVVKGATNASELVSSGLLNAGSEGNFSQVKYNKLPVTSQIHGNQFFRDPLARSVAIRMKYPPN
jgi:hypothetical protein